MKLLLEIAAGEVQHRRAAMTAGARLGSALQRGDELPHLGDRKGLAGADRGVAGRADGDRVEPRFALSALRQLAQDQSESLGNVDALQRTDELVPAVASSATERSNTVISSGVSSTTRGSSNVWRSTARSRN